MVERARLVGNLDGEHRRHRRNAARLGEHPLRFVRIADDRAEHAEVGGLRERQRAHVDAVGAQELHELRKLPGFIFYKDGNLFDCHGLFPLHNLIPPSIIINFSLYPYG
ncbi:hypothetical protein SDC9_162189 [bioreactor metagenome]|uniref:Uncharacterized protein n=1 Tax=bioreactor metagenome TaxID=1076179 RepID=A0A645FLP7_9ZZZZ